MSTSKGEHRHRHHKGKGKSKKDRTDKTESAVAPAPVPVPVSVCKIRLYIIHTPLLTERKSGILGLVDQLIRQSPRLQVESVLVTKPNPADVTADAIKTCVKLAMTEDPEWDAHVHNMHINQVSNALKHAKCLELIAASDASPDVLHLVVEDDVCYGERIATDLTELSASLLKRSDWDLVFLGLPGKGVPAGQREFPLVSDAVFAKVLPGCDSYAITPAAARRLRAEFLPVRFCTNKHFSYVFAKTADPQKYAVRYSEPNMFSDGSKTGKFVSSLDPNNMLVYNQDWVNAFNLLSAHRTAGSVIDAAELRKCMANLEGSVCKDSPDMIHMRAMLSVLKSDFAGAHELFTHAYEAFDKNHAVINNDSIFLRNYLANFKHVQTIPA